MYSSRLLQLSILALSLLVVAQAAWLEDLAHLRPRSLVRRQRAGVSDSSDTDQSTGSSPVVNVTPSIKTLTSTLSSPVNKPSSSAAAAAPTSSRRRADATSSDAPAENTSLPTPTASPTTSPDAANRSQKTSSDASPAATSTKADDENAASPTPTPVVSTSTFVVTKTNNDGSQTVETTQKLTTSTPGLNASDSAESSGMSTKTRNTVIGVVVGVGGAVVLGVLALVAWRIWGRKKQLDENDGLMDFNIVSMEKPGRASSAGPHQTPFQSTLENYHQPTTQVNASSNF
ncbi:hypothetical protein DCS_02169 [Drechmeria coniospora]|uniref:Mid2 domain-containing protein n=1 Tax=Drechmeria coniospora TaxID=98403 RepID=A0A151GV98_DRECN|nr:hypothetical protein DCS_02169 [Drechmeria coniospora]KYK61029.1 hypothetical protein DCS_02169 [Drechmeria coniospora]ODA83326.1 hypothetical protein RJ55_01839 [Drechmeria coniospora]